MASMERNLRAIREKPKTFLVYEGGKEVIPKPDGAKPSGPDWLRELGHGARFVCHPKNTVGCWLDQFGIAFIMDECILLAKTEGLGMSMGWVDSKIFSMSYRLVAILPESPEGDNGASHRQPDVEAGNKHEHNSPRSTDSKDNDGHEGPA